MFEDITLKYIFVVLKYCNIVSQRIFLRFY